MKLKITNGTVIIDKDDYEKVSKYKWHINDTGYAVWRGIKDGRKQTIRMHRLIANTPKGMITDHINHNPLDNRKSNLRICTQSTNMRNKSTRKKGYWYQKQNNNWVVEIQGTHRGVFKTELEAQIFANRCYLGLAYKLRKQPRVSCKYGHSLENAYDYGKGKMCRTCQSERSRQYYVRKTKRQNVSNNGK